MERPRRCLGGEEVFDADGRRVYGPGEASDDALLSLFILAASRMAPGAEGYAAYVAPSPPLVCLSADIRI
jgi:hypothetical protein